MKKHVMKLIALLAIGASVNAFNAYAAEAADTKETSKLLMYIQPVDYNNPIKLWSPYQDYWFYQGPVVEKLAMPKLAAAYHDVKVCDANQSGKALLWLQPELFYNPQVQMFYAEVKASAYKGVGEHLATVVGRSQVRGVLTIKPETWIEKAYALAVNDAVAKMQADKTLQAYMNGPAQAGNNAPCSMVTLFPTPKVRVMSF